MYAAVPGRRYENYILKILLKILRDWTIFERFSIVLCGKQIEIEISKPNAELFKRSILEN